MEAKTLKIIKIATSALVVFLLVCGFWVVESNGYYEGYKGGQVIGIKQGKEYGYRDGYWAGKDYGYGVGYEKGYDEGYKSDRLVDPTYAEVKEFLDSKKSLTVLASRGASCVPRAITLRNEIHERGFRVGVAFIRFPTFTIGNREFYPSHLIVAFNTTDSGLCFLDWVPIDRIPNFSGSAFREGEVLWEVKAKKGESYYQQNNLEFSGYNTTIRDIEFLW